LWQNEPPHLAADWRFQPSGTSPWDSVSFGDGSDTLIAYVNNNLVLRHNALDHFLTLGHPTIVQGLVGSNLTAAERTTLARSRMDVYWSVERGAPGTPLAARQVVRIHHSSRI